MSLAQRVRTVGGLDQAAKDRTHERLLSRLRSEMDRILPSDVLATMVKEHPLQAKSEIRSACGRVFSQTQWATCDEVSREHLVADLLDSIFGLGIIQPLIDDDSVTEVMVNSTDSVYFERDGKLMRSSVSFSDEGQIRTLIDRIVASVGRRVDEASPMVDARLPGGYRVNAVVPPVAIDGPSITIRKFGDSVMRLSQMEASGSFDARMRMFFEWMVASRCNVAVSGGTGSGKTTLLNALSCEISHDERIVTIEDSAELRFLEHPHVVRLEARPRNAEGVGEVTIRDLVANALRMRPDRIIVGECRGAEALDMLQAMNTGHDGSLTTLHANSPDDLVLRLATMVRYGADLPIDVVEANIASAIDVVVQLARSRTGRRYVSAVAELRPGGACRPCEVHALYAAAENDAGSWCAAPSWLHGAVDKGVVGAKEVERWLRWCSLAPA